MWTNEGRRTVQYVNGVSLRAIGCSGTRAKEEVEGGGDEEMKGGDMKGDGTRGEKSWDFMNTTSGALAPEMRCSSDQMPSQSDASETAIRRYSDHSRLNGT